MLLVLCFLFGSHLSTELCLLNVQVFIKCCKYSEFVNDNYFLNSHQKLTFQNIKIKKSYLSVHLSVVQTVEMIAVKCIIYIIAVYKLHLFFCS